ncbi:MAG: hypothetical protein RL223_3413 [Pseudomonadota bacterium]
MLFDSSVRRELGRSFGATLVVILTIVITMMLIRVIGMAASGNVAPQDVALLLAYFALGYLPTMLALSLFVAIIVTLGRMYRDSEMAVWFAAGLTLRRFVRPVLWTAWPVLLAAGAMLLVVWPWAKRAGDELRQRYEQRSDLSRVSPGVFQSSRDGSRVFFVDSASEQGVLGHHVFVLARGAHGESLTTALRGQVVPEGDDRLLRLEQGQRNATADDGGRTVASFERYEVIIGDQAARRAQERDARVMDTLELLRSDDRRHRGELAWRFGMLAASVNLALLGIGLAATTPRRPSNWNLLFALLAFIVYFNLVNLSQAWVASGRFSLAAALLVLHGLVAAGALGLIRWRDQGGHGLRWPWRRQPPTTTAATGAA